MPYSHDQEGGLYQAVSKYHHPSSKNINKSLCWSCLMSLISLHRPSYYYQSSYPSTPNQLIQATLLRSPRIATSLAPEHPQHLAAVTGEASSMGDRRTVPSGQEKVSQVALWKARATSPSQGEEQRDLWCNSFRKTVKWWINSFGNINLKTL